MNMERIFMALLQFQQMEKEARLRVGVLLEIVWIRVALILCACLIIVKMVLFAMAIKVVSAPFVV